MVDADHGYGNALNVKRTVEELETAGVAGMSIEDTELPTPHGTTKPRLTSIAEGVGKMKAALAGRQDPLLSIAGRTSAIQISGLDDAIARGQAYEAAGVDALFFVGIKTRAELDALSAATRLPIIMGGVSGDLADHDYLSARRVRIALQGHQPFAAAVKAVHDTLQALRDGRAARQAEGRRRRRNDEARHARGRLHEMVKGFPGGLNAPPCRSRVGIVARLGPFAAGRQGDAGLCGGGPAIRPRRIGRGVEGYRMGLRPRGTCVLRHIDGRGTDGGGAAGDCDDEEQWHDILLSLVGGERAGEQPGCPQVREMCPK